MPECLKFYVLLIYWLSFYINYWNNRQCVLNTYTYSLIDCRLLNVEWRLFQARLGREQIKIKQYVYSLIWDDRENGLGNSYCHLKMKVFWCQRTRNGLLKEIYIYIDRKTVPKQGITFNAPIPIGRGYIFIEPAYHTKHGFDCQMRKVEMTIFFYTIQSLRFE